MSDYDYATEAIKEMLPQFLQKYAAQEVLRDKVWMERLAAIIRKHEALRG